MLGKLLKYEFKATSRIFLPMFGALLIVAAFSRLFMSLSFDVPSVIGVTVSVIMIIGIIVMTFLLTIQRFNKNLLGSEGYLMFTLPVSTDRLIVRSYHRALDLPSHHFSFPSSMTPNKQYNENESQFISFSSDLNSFGLLNYRAFLYYSPSLTLTCLARPLVIRRGSSVRLYIYQMCFRCLSIVLARPYDS
jgi:type IV secretory pathway VirB3-like protein